jgi:hypothetical protein
LSTNLKPKKITEMQIKISIPKIKLNANANVIFNLIKKDIANRTKKNIAIHSRHNFASDQAIYLWQVMSVALASNKIMPKKINGVQVLPINNSADNALIRREWCKLNNLPMINARAIIEHDKFVKRPANNLRMRFSRITKGKELGYVTVLSTVEILQGKNKKLNDMVFIYRIK